MKNINPKNIANKICIEIFSLLTISNLIFSSSQNLKMGQFKKITLIKKLPRKENPDIQNLPQNQNFSSNLSSILNPTAPLMQYSNENETEKCNKKYGEKRKWTLEDYNYLLRFIHENSYSIQRKNFEKNWKEKILHPYSSVKNKCCHVERILWEDVKLQSYFDEYYKSNFENSEEFTEEHRIKIEELIKKVNKIRNKNVQKKNSGSELKILKQKLKRSMIRKSKLDKKIENLQREIKKIQKNG
ncbi:MAG: hypothetical protein LBI77_00665 [Puniceicoccales bacterium]|nr:hypothetical protein [Puniceicoccales bacterium]